MIIFVSVRAVPQCLQGTGIALWRADWPASRSWAGGAIAVIGGMITAPLLSMLVIPAAYYLMRRPRMAR